MILANRLRATALASVLIGSVFVACATDPTSSPSETPSATPTSESPSAATGGFVDHPRIITTQTSRVFSAQRAAEKAVQKAALDEFRVHPELADGGPPPNWTLTTTAKVLGSVGIYGASFTTSSSQDMMYFGTNGSATGTLSGGFNPGSPAATITGNNFFAFNNLHSTKPTLVWAGAVGSGLTASVGLSADGTRVFALGDNGVLYCFTAAGNAGASAKCANWANPTLSLTGAGITPWLEYGNNAIYVNNGANTISRINMTSGLVQWSYKFSNAANSRGWPLEANNIIYIGDGTGSFFRIQDPTTGPMDSQNMTAPTVEASTALSASACGGNVSIDSSASLDSTANLVFLSYNGCGVSFPHYCAASAGCSVTTGTWAIKNSASSASTPDNTQQTWPALDGSYLYWVVADKPGGSTPISALWKSPYNLSAVHGSNLQNTSGASVGSAPVVYNGLAYVGDQSGQVEEFGCASSASATTAFVAETSVTGGTVGTPIEFDDATGNIEYGFTSTTGGGVAQFPLWVTGSADAGAGYSWFCPSGMVACDHQVCGAGNNKTACVPTAACSSASCSTVASITGATIQVGAAQEHTTITATGADGGASSTICPSGTVILGIVGADYGTPPSSDATSSATFNYSSTCSATDSLSVIEGKCQTSPAVNTCTVTADNSTFGDTCVGTFKNFYGWFVCGPSSAGSPTFCSRQNIVPTSGSDPCVSGTCSGTCSTG